MAAPWLRFIAAPQPVGWVDSLIAWHAGRPWAPCLLLVQMRPNAAALIVGAATLSAAGMLIVIGLHLLAH
jgi:hypothetical protein